MKNKLFLSLPLLFCVLHSLAQRNVTGIVKGRLTDTTYKEAIENATVSLLKATDTTVLFSVKASEKGAFRVKNIMPGSYRLVITHESYQQVTRSFTMPAGLPQMDMGIINMERRPDLLAAIIVKRPPMSVKKDTLEYIANAYTTKPNAVAEDLLKKLPGVEVDKDGTIKAQGEQVTRILVDGKRFFGNDPQMATKNLPPDVIDKIQIFDAQSDQSAFSGFDDGNRTKTINIVIKKDKKKGYFGKASAGIGNKSLYEAGVNINRFKGDQQMSIIGQTNNVNRQGFSGQDFLGSFGGGGGGRGGGRGFGGRRGGGGGGMGNFGGGSSGLTTTYAGGLNYHNTWGGDKTDIAGSYFYNKQDVNRDQASRQQNLLSGDSTLFNQVNNQNLVARSTNENHRFDFNLEQKIDSLNSLIIRPNISYQRTSSGNDRTTNIVSGKGLSVSNSTSLYDNENSGYNASLDVLFRHRFKKRGRTISFGLNGGYNSNDGSGSSYTETQSFEEDGLTFRRDTVNQQNFSNTNSKNFSGTISYTEPVSEHHQLELNYNYSANKNISDRKTYNFDPASNQFNVLDTGLSNNFENTYMSNRATLSYRVNYSSFNASIGSGVQLSELTSINNSKDTRLRQSFTNMYPTATFNYNLERSKSLRFNYDGRTSQPNVTQLQDVTDYSDPLNIRQGNPSLKQSFNHSFRLMYNSFNIETMRNVFLTFNAAFTQNNISNSVITVVPGMTLPPGVPDSTPAGAQITRPVNLNGNYNMSMAFNYSLPLKKPKSNLNLGGNLTHNQSVNLQNDGKTGASIKNFNKNYALTGTVRWTTNLSKDFDVNFTSGSTYNIAKYSVQSTQSGNYFMQSLGTEFTYYTANGWIVSTDFDYKYYGRGAGFNTSVPLLNASVAKQLFKNKAGEIRLSIYDLLNQNVSITRNITENYIQDVTNKVLTRYALLTFTYNLRRFGGQRMPGLFRSMHGPGNEGSSGSSGMRNMRRGK
ncbi:MAG TPA: outer membrane beta-barrel family protein [Chitinophagaceae bacterium]|nr:outer membrane beta-barrel family protein [Chitinophagaceae bacterium]